MNYDFLSYDAVTDPGCERGNNEDSYAVVPEDGCYFVADGMGGGEAGELASEFVRQSVVDAITGTAEDSPGIRKYAVQQAIHKANHAIRKYADEQGYRLMGSTIVLFMLNPWRPDVAMVCHVGDSRLYCLHDGEFFQVTRDHTVGAEIAHSSQKAKEFRHLGNHQKSAISHMLTRGIGTSNLAAPEWDDLAISPHDRIIICSDGLTTMLDDDAIEKIVKANSNVTDCVNALKDATIAAGAKDNVTIIGIDVGDEIPAPAEHSADEEKENDYLMKISESRIDNA